MTPQEMIHKLSQFDAEDPSCKKVYCSTCGGLVSAIKKNMTPVLKEEIDTLLVEYPDIDYQVSGEWREFFQDISGS